MKKNHTLILFETEDGSKFFVIEEDLSRFDDVYIGQEDTAVEAELSDLLFNQYGSFKLTPIEKPTKDYTWFIKCGSL